MIGKNIRIPKMKPSVAAMLLGAVFALTALRLSIALSGEMNPAEALLSVCADHPAGGYAEGPAGVPLLLTAVHFLGMNEFSLLRWISPMAALLLSWSVWRIGKHVAFHRPTIPLCSVLGVNLLPSVNLAALSMNGAIISASMILFSIDAGWNAVLSRGKTRWKAWILFGAVLSVATFFYLPVGWLLPAAVLFRFLQRGEKAIPWRGFLMAAILLALGLVFPIAWNIRHDWIQWSSVAPGFDTIPFGAFSCSLTLLVALSSLSVPFLLRLASSGVWWRTILLLLALPLFGISLFILLAPSSIPSSLPSPLGVRGVGNFSKLILSIRDERPDVSGGKPFLIAATPQLAALLGGQIQIDYPERPGAPSVFATESPSLNSSFSLWPTYADAVAAGVKDPFYTEEKSVSPFLGHNALYITTESAEELPQVITGAFGAVALLKETELNWNGRPTVIRIYQCENYRMLSL